MDCHVCKDDPIDCNLVRGALDYFNDAKRGITNGWNISALLSLRNGEDNAKRKLVISGITPPELSESLVLFWQNNMEIRKSYLIELLNSIYPDRS